MRDQLKGKHPGGGGVEGRDRLKGKHPGGVGVANLHFDRVCLFL